MKKFNISIFALFSMLIASCSDSQEVVTPTLGDDSPKCFTVETNLGVESRAAISTSESFYLYLDQSIVDNFVKMKYDTASSSWKAYSVADDSVEIELLILDDLDQVGVVALLCGATSLSADQFLSTYSYSVGESPIYYANREVSGAGAIAISDEGVISIEFALEVACLDILFAGDATEVASVAVSGISSGISWNAYSYSSAELVDSLAVAATMVDSSTYSLYVAPQSVSTLSISVSLSDGSAKSYVVGTAEFVKGEKLSVTLNI